MTKTDPPAPLWRRLAAMLYDSFLVFAIWVLVGSAVLWAFGIEDSRSLQEGTVVLATGFRLTLFAAMLLSAFGFFAVFWTKSGQTLGMQAWKIRVQNPDGSPIALRQCLLRVLTAPPAFLLLGLGYLAMYADPRRRTLPDRVSDSEVVVLKSRSVK